MTMGAPQNKNKKIILPSLNKSPVRVSTNDNNGAIGAGNQNGNRKQVAFAEETTTITAGGAGIPADVDVPGKNVRVRFSIEE